MAHTQRLEESQVRVEGVEPMPAPGMGEPVGGTLDKAVELIIEGLGFKEQFKELFERVPKEEITRAVKEVIDWEELALAIEENLAILYELEVNVEEEEEEEEIEG